MELASFLLDRYISLHQVNISGKKRDENVLDFPVVEGHTLLHTMVTLWVLLAESAPVISIYHECHRFHLILLEDLISTVLLSNESLINAVENLPARAIYELPFKTSVPVEKDAVVQKETIGHMLSRAGTDLGLNLLYLFTEKKVDFSVKNSSGDTLLTVAIKSQWLHGISYLLKKCPSLLDLPDDRSDFPLHIAVKQAARILNEKALQVLGELLQHSPFKESWDAEGRCITHLCVLNETDENGIRVCHIFDLLSRHGMSLNENTELGETPLSLAIEYGQEYSMRSIFRFGQPDIRTQLSDSRQTVLHLALQVLKKDESTIQRCMLECLLEEASKLPSISRKALYDNCLGITVDDAYKELNKVFCYKR